MEELAPALVELYKENPLAFTFILLSFVEGLILILILFYWLMKR